MTIDQKKLYKLLKTTFNPEGDIHLLGISTLKTDSTVEGRPVYQVRVALTFKEGDRINPYYDGTDVFIIWDEDEISFTREEEWIDGPPLVEGSPVELALGWVSELTEPFYISPEALAAAHSSPRFSDSSEDTDDKNQGKEGLEID